MSDPVDKALHTGPAVGVLIDGTRVLRIAGSPFAAKEEKELRYWRIFLISTRQVVGFTTGDKTDVRRKLVETERDYLENLQPKGLI